MNNYKKISNNSIVKFLGRPNIFVFAIAWMIVLVVIGTLDQSNIGLYLSKEKYFLSWITFFGFMPVPSGKLLMFIISINLSFYFTRPNIFKLSKIGITITHMGALLLLIGAGITAKFSQEGRMPIEEGKTSNYFEDYYKKELVVINTSNIDYDEFTTFDQSILYNGNIISNNETLPFEIDIKQFHKNCEYVDRKLLNNEYEGAGKFFYISREKPEKEYEQNRACIAFEISGTDTNNNGNYIVYQGPLITNLSDEVQGNEELVEQFIIYNENKFYLDLRNKRTYLPFEIKLIDFNKTIHPNTDIAKSFSSDINLIHENYDRGILIKMNEPLRHEGYTFYQASFQDQGFYTYNDSYYYDTRFWKDRTVLAVVKNYGRLFPYISSIIMCIGILIHLLLKIPKKKNATNI